MRFQIYIQERLKKYSIRTRIIAGIASLISLYLLIALYFVNHLYMGTEINGVKVSLKSQEESVQAIKDYLSDYKLEIIDREDNRSEITAQEAGLQYNEKKSISQIYKRQNALAWITSLFKKYEYSVVNLYTYDRNKLDQRIRSLDCMNQNYIEPQNVSFTYTDGSYKITKEIIGNKINEDRLREAVRMYLVNGKRVLELEAGQCYENPKYTTKSNKTAKTRNLLDQYVSAKIIYTFGEDNEVLEGSTISRWLSVNDNLDVVINKTAVINYIKVLRSKYDTVGITRSFQASGGRTVEVVGGLYGWKINQTEEAKELIDNIKQGKEIEREPIYTQRALYRDKDDIGDTYIEINISRQHLWFYKNGKLIAQGSVVTGNPNRGNSTVRGTYMVIYKQNNATLSGPGYSVAVTYWMPFFGNMGVHDAKWRYSFGGEIYKRNGTHGCVNAPYYLAKTIYDNIEEGTPVVIYEEEPVLR